MLFSPKKEGSDRRYILFAFRIMTEILVMIAAPLFLLLFVGNMVDENRGGGYAGKLIAFPIAAVVTAAIVYKKAKEYGKEYSNIEKEK